MDILSSPPGDYYRKQFDRAPDAWEVLVRHVGEDGDASDEVLGTLQTEALADALLAHLTPGRTVWTADWWYGPY